MGRIRDILAESTEQEIVGHRLAGFQRRMAGLETRAAYNHLGRVRFNCISKRLDVAGCQMEAVGARAPGYAGIVDHDCRGAGILHERHQPFGEGLEFSMLAAGRINQNGCDITPGKGAT
uniref:ATPase n=1 Tax=Fulvimarina pelagi TaxID=217511 RepID=A0A0P0ZAR4_9HYPH|nr:ATPase [Fulvimarina pelagi]